ncbi:LPS export ABC transporter periplasmic protein LptC [uncultured Nonlabens sp.]|uniref:LPS export ABC transporter periplasmic protein LptC n=1 Tax=uncultured Nonlabens sp. TaxID=859306 RepID=UPI00262BCD28|nr:LPS export ABC transporter periplasmic protein LptC [uncultured Nonlabens sp.]
MRSYTHLLKITITAIAVICFFASCDDNLKEIQKMEIASNEPIGEVEEMLLKHTDSGKLKLTVRGNKMLDFKNDNFPYQEFPEGIKVEVYDYSNDKTEVTVITANSGIMYEETKLVDLKGDVLITTSDGTTFKGDQLYWDQAAKWIFTNEKFETLILDGENKENIGKITGTVLDAREDLKKSLTRNPDDNFVTQNNHE